MMDALQEILYTLQRNKLRTFLTAFGVFWGIFLLILLLGAGNGLEHGAQAQFKTNAQNSVWLWSRKTSVPYKGLGTNRKIKFQEADVEALRREIPGIDHIAIENPVGSTNGGDSLVTHGKRYGNFGIFGVSDAYFNIKSGLDYHHGRHLNALDDAESRKIAMIGTIVAERLFPNVNPIGKYIEVNKIIFRVVGLYYDSDANGRYSERIYIPLSVFQRTFGRGESQAKIIMYTPKPGYGPYKVEQQVLNLLKQRHQIAPSDRSALRSYNSYATQKQIQSMLMGIKAFIWFVGIGTLAAGVVGISNIMMITVKERTTEIGIRKALGARPRNIISTLLFESVLVTSIAGYLGLVIGVAFLEAVSYGMKVFGIQTAYFDRPEVDFNIALSALAILIVVGLLAGLAPAWKAARISPVEAMRAS